MCFLNNLFDFIFVVFIYVVLIFFFVRWTFHTPGAQWMLNFQACRHMGHCLFIGCRFSHLTMQCIWKQCEQTPHTNGQSSPGSAHSGQVLSNDIRQMPQFSSFAIQRHDATPIHDLIVTFILGTFRDIFTSREEKKKCAENVVGECNGSKLMAKWRIKRKITFSPHFSSNYTHNFLFLPRFPVYAPSDSNYP